MVRITMRFPLPRFSSVCPTDDLFCHSIQFRPRDLFSFPRCLDASGIEVGGEREKVCLSSLRPEAGAKKFSHVHKFSWHRLEINLIRIRSFCDALSSAVFPAHFRLPSHNAHLVRLFNSQFFCSNVDSLSACDRWLHTLRATFRLPLDDASVFRPNNHLSQILIAISGGMRFILSRAETAPPRVAVPAHSSRQ